MMQARRLPASWGAQECTIVRQSGAIIRLYVSAIDRDLVNGATFHSGYIRLRWRGGYLHTLIALRLFGSIPEGYTVDHIDQNRLNNVRANLRLATPRGQNLRATDRPLGYQRRKGRWRAYGDAPDGRKYLGNFSTAIEAQ